MDNTEGSAWEPTDFRAPPARHPTSAQIWRQEQITPSWVTQFSNWPLFLVFCVSHYDPSTLRYLVLQMR
jgi:hypothetical protein